MTKLAEKDWSGNKRTNFATLGASNHADHERAENDYYATPTRAGLDLIRIYPSIKDIWECACGGGSLCVGFDEVHKLSRSSDLIDRGYGEGGVDFLLQTEPWAGWIVTNPPYKFALEFAERAIELAQGGVALFLRVQFLESQKRQRLFIKSPPNFVYVYAKRCPQCALNGDFSNPTGNATTYCWFIWDKSLPKHEPIIRWL